MAQGKRAKGINGSAADWLTVSDVARILQVTEETVRRYIREGRMKAEKKRTKGLRKVWLVHKAELEKFNSES